MSTKAIELHDKQKEFIQSDKRYKLLNWGRRSGKTFAVGYEIFITLWKTEDALVSYYAPTRDDARDIAWEDFRRLLKDITVKTNETMLEIVVKNQHGGTSMLKMYGWEAVKNRDKGRGVENDLVVLDECAFFPQFTEKFGKVIEPTLLTSKGRLIVTSTPNGFNHFYEMYKNAVASDDWYVSHATSYDNPHNDPEDLEKIKSEKDLDVFEQEYLANFRRMQGLVYKDFSEERHVTEETCDTDQIVSKIGCIDFGYTNPSAMLTIFKDRADHYWISDEYYESGKVTDELVQVMTSKELDAWYPDPAEPDRIEQMRRAGLRVKEVSKDIKAGIASVTQLLRENRLHIHPSCSNLLFEINNYRYRDQGKSNIDLNEPELPIKENDHLLDALRYALHMMETVDPGSKKVKSFYSKLAESRLLNPNRKVGAAE